MPHPNQPAVESRDRAGSRKATTTRCAVLLSSLLAVACGQRASAPQPKQQPDPTHEVAAAAVTDSRTHRLASTSIDQEYVIDVALPLDYDGSENEYPTLYVLDGDLLFGLATDVSRLLPLEALPPFLGRERVPGLIVVGIAYPGGMTEMAEKRNRDFNPPEGESGEINPDGAENFHRFLTEQLFPLIESTYRADPADRTLLGTSRGGVFVLSSLLLHPDAFQRYVAISPTIEPPIYTYLEERRSDPSSLSGRLNLSTGSEGAIESGIASQVTQLTSVLEEHVYPQLLWSRQTLEGESHASVVPRAVVEGLVAVFSDAP